MTLKARLDLPPKEAVAFFARKGEVLAWDWTDVWRDQNSHAFTVAKVTDLELLRAIRAEVAKAIEGGITFEEFARTLRPRLQALGWWGKQEVLDAGTGELTKVQLGSNRRLRTIFQTNVQTAYMAGRYKRFLENAADRPYWRYVGILDGRIRPAHLALHNKVWRWNDPIWSVIWPPNGWGCRCRVVAMTEAEFKASGLPLQDGASAIGTMRVPVNRAGDQVDVKVVRFIDNTGKPQVFRPDPGWDYNPGQARSRFDPGSGAREGIGQAPVTAPATITSRGVTPLQAADGLRTWADLGRPLLTAPDVPKLPAPALLPPSAPGAEALDVASRLIASTGAQAGTVATPIGEVALRAEHLVGALTADAGREAYFSWVAPALKAPFEIWLMPYADGTYRTKFLAVVGGARDMLLMVRLNRDGSLTWDAYDLATAGADTLNRLRAGTLLYEAKP